VRGEDERGQAGLGDLDAQLLVQFADQALLGRLAGLDLAAGKLPQAGQRLALGRWQISTRPSTSIRAAAATRTVGLVMRP
jgi:hypothetical protein